MQTYDCTVRLSGSMKNEVPKCGVTAAEIEVLRALHQAPDAGVNAIINIKAAGNVKRTDREERARLTEMYGPALAKNERIRSLETLLGHPSVPLPDRVEGVNGLAPAPKNPRRAKVKPVEPETPDPSGEDAREPELAGEFE